MIRPPKSLSNMKSFETKHPTGIEVLEAEMIDEQAYALSLAAKKMTAALDNLKRSNGDPRRTQLAADATYAFFIQREMLGSSNHDYAIEFYKNPNAVLARVGAKDSDS